MISFWLRKFFKTLLYFFVVSQVLYWVWSFLPGDFVDVALKDSASFEEKTLWKNEFGLSGDTLTRWKNFEYNFYFEKGGRSWSFNRPVFSVILERIPGSLFLALWSSLVSLTSVILLSLYASDKDRLSRRLKQASAFLLGFPIIVIGPFFILIFSVYFIKLAILSSSIVFPPLLAVLLLSWTQFLVAFPLFLETVRSLWKQPFVIGLRSRGISLFDIKYKHLFKNLIPLLATQMAVWFSSVISGVLILEVLFEIPGMGKLFQEALLSRDLPLVHALVLTFSGIYIFCFNIAEVVSNKFYPGRSL
ncbi:MAG: ABC transporter permease [Proteobacteria bacterium]|nr:ABC transporter permease [Pseudomonadota bacterium]